MPDEAAMPKLTPEAQERVLQWLCEGFRNSEVLERLQGQFDIPLTRQAIDYYRDKWAEEITAAQDEAERRAKQQGLGNRLRRLGILERKVDKLDEALDASAPAQWQGLCAELRALLKDIRDEFGDLKTRQELTGKDGKPIQVEIASEDVKRFIQTLGQVIHEHVSNPDERNAIIRALGGGAPAATELGTDSSG